MRKMLKMTFFSMLVLAGAGFLLFGTSLGSYAKTAFQDVRQKIKSSVPIDFELRRARRLIRRIDPEILDARKDVARAEVALETLQTDIAALEKAITKGESRVRRTAGMLQREGAFRLTVYGRRWSRAQVERELARSFDMVRNQTELLKSKKALVERQSKILDAARRKLAAVRQEKARLEDLVEALEAKKRQLDALAASAHRFDLDTSSLGEARKVLEEVRRRLDVTQKLIQEELFFTVGAEEDEGEVRDILAEIGRYFGRKAGGAEGSEGAVPVDSAKGELLGGPPNR